MSNEAKGAGYAAVVVGSVFVWAGLKGYGILATIQNVIQGKPPATGQTPDSLSTPGKTAAANANVSGNLGSGNGAAIAADAMTYVGKLTYCYGGAMKGSANGCPVGQPDCSSFVNWVVGHDMGLAIPDWGAGKYNGTQHGPATGSWQVWGGTTGVARANVQAGDVCVWPSHMGIIINSTQFVSAVDPQEGIKIGVIDQGAPSSWEAPLVRYRRLRAVQGSKGASNLGGPPPGKLATL